MAPLYSHRLRLKRIERKPKRWLYAGNSPDIRLVLDAHEIAALAHLPGFILAGDEVPDSYCRPSLDRRSDPLLSKRGIMHLHLSNKALAFVIQYDDAVMLVRVDSHKTFSLQPEGADIPEYEINRAEQRHGLTVIPLPNDPDED